MQMKADVSQADDMIQDIEDMHGILVQFADYAKTGKEEEPLVGNFNQVVAEVCQRYAAAGKAIKPDLATLPAFRFRALAIRRLVTNLVDNASRYGAGDIEVITRFTEGTTVLTVRDRGPGIRSTDPNSLIKPFAREDIARGMQLGAGLGLSIVDRIAGAHGGVLVLCNRAGGGLEATVTLPFSGA
jgi:two-component system, OmpR family, osmolarity sensor histidine kinase EnvZ